MQVNNETIFRQIYLGMMRAILILLIYEEAKKKHARRIAKRVAQVQTSLISATVWMISTAV